MSTNATGPNVGAPNRATTNVPTVTVWRDGWECTCGASSGTNVVAGEIHARIHHADVDLTIQLVRAPRPVRVVLDRQTIIDMLAATCDFTTTERERWADALIAAGRPLSEECA